MNDLPFLTEVTKVNTATMAVLAEPIGPTGITTPVVVKQVTQLTAYNSPNPFRNTTNIHYSIPASAGTDYPVTLSIYTLSNQLVKTLVNELKIGGSYRVEWDGRDRSGKSVPAGVYLYSITAAARSISRKMVFIK